MDKSKQHKLILGILIAVEALLGIAAVAFLFKKQNSIGITNDVKLFCTLNMVCMLLSVIFQIGCLLHYIKKQRFFFLCLTSELIGMVMDIFRCLLDGMPEYNMYHSVCVTLISMLTVTIFFALVRFVIDSIVNSNDNYNLLVKFINAGYVIAMLTRLGNIWGGYYMAIDESGHPAVQNLYFLIVLYPLCIIFIIVVILILSKISISAKVVVICILVVSIVLGSLSELLYNSNLIYALLTISSIILYGFFLIEKKYYEYDRVKSFGGFLPRVVAEKLIDEKTGETHKGKRLNVTLMKIRLVDYYTLIKDLPSKNKNILFNKCMDMFIGCIEDNGGIVINYEGDGAICAFGVPDTASDHADEALNAAFDIMNKIDNLNNKNKEEDLPEVNACIGMCSGIALFTCLKAGERTYYTALTTMVDDCKKIADQAETGQIIMEQSTLNDISIPTKAIYLSRFETGNTLYPVSLYEARHQETF